MFHRVAVGAEHMLRAAEGAHQHQQGRFRQMEIGQQRVHDPETVTRIDKNFCLAFIGCHASAVCRRRSRRPASRDIGTSLCGSLQRSHHGGADRHDAPPFLLRRIDFIAGGLRYAEILRMHAVLADIIHTDRLKCPGSDVQGDKGGLHPHSLETREHGLVEMQTGGRRGDCTRMVRIHRLIAFAVARIVRTFDVRRERNMTDTLKNLRHRGIRFEFQMVKLPLALLHGHGNIPFQRKFLSRLRRLACTYLGQHMMSIQNTLHQHFDAPATVLVAKEARGNHARVVEHQQIACPQQRGQIGKTQIAPGAARAIEGQQTAGGARRCRILRDQIVGK